MSAPFDPYRAWLGIPAEEQPPNHYRLLNLDLFESDPATIERAAEQRVGILHAFQTGDHAKAAVKLLNEVAQAKVCLLNPNRKAGYDAGVRRVLRIKAEQAETAATEEAKKAAAERALAARFLGVLKEKVLLPSGMLESLRKQAAESKEPLSAATIAKDLVEKGLLTPELAKRLLMAAAKENCPADSAPAATLPQQQAPLERRKREPDLPSRSRQEEEEEELGLAPLEEERHKLGFPPPKDDRPAAVASGLPEDEELPPLAEGYEDSVRVQPLDGLLADAVLAAGSPLAPRVPKKKGLQGSRILIGGAALLALAILAAVLFLMLRG